MQRGGASDNSFFATYSTLNDMLNHTNPTFTFTTQPNIVSTGSDGTTYWNLINVEGIANDNAIFSTYSTLNDMLTYNGTNFTFTDSPDIVGTGSDGTTYWNLFNPEGESSTLSTFLTYATLGDMLNNTDPTGITFGPSAVVGTGAFFVPDPNGPVVPLPAAVWMFLTALGGLGLFGWRRKRATT